MNTASPPDISPVWLYDPATKSSVQAELWDAITDKNLGDWEVEWLPELQARLKTLHGKGVERSKWPQSRHWDWRKKMRSIEGLLANQCFSIVCDNMTQAMMITDLTHRSQLEPKQGSHLVYIEYLETAPWNRKEIQSQDARFSGCGSIMLRAAIELSKEEGFQGRVGLHSLPQANNFYANHVGMTDLGIDKDYQNLRYFELTPDQAEAYLTKGQ